MRRPGQTGWPPAEKEIDMSVTTSTPARTFTLPRGPVLVGTLYSICVIVPLLIFVGIILFTDEDPHKPQGAIESIQGIALFGHIALAVAVAVLFATRAAPRAAAGAIVLTVLSLVTLVFFWSGAPGILGAAAAWRAGLTRGAQPQNGPARVAGLIGAFIAGLNILLTLGGFALAFLGAGS
jgi:hypothetical protein